MQHDDSHAISGYEISTVPLPKRAKRGGLSNNAMQLTGRPGTHLAVPAPPRISSKGGAQGARPSRPAADRGRCADGT